MYKATFITTHEPLQAQNYASNGNIEFMQEHPVTEAHAPL
jgi:hypothetical protein